MQYFLTLLPIQNVVYFPICLGLGHFPEIVHILKSRIQYIFLKELFHDTLRVFFVCFLVVCMVQFLKFYFFIIPNEL